MISISFLPFVHDISEARRVNMAMVAKTAFKFVTAARKLPQAISTV